VQVDVAIVGGGIAGMSLAGELSREPGLRVTVLEQEDQLAYHATGRSAAAFLESYGSTTIRALTQASRPMLASGTDDDPSLLAPRPLLWTATETDVSELEHLLAAEPLVTPLDVAQALRLCPALRPGWAAAAAIEEGAQDLDVAGLYQRYRGLALRNGVTVQTRSRLRNAEPNGPGWLVRTEAGDLSARTVVNAAGAWADEVARNCGVARLGLTAMRRTVAVASATVDRSWPLVADVAETFYFRPEGDGLLVSPADETPMPATDAQPEPLDVALALERVNEATTLGLTHVRRAWAGLRTFAPDRDLVVGPDPEAAGFFWVVGQGGYGMQTAPAVAMYAAALIRGDEPPFGIAPGALSPGRFRTP
jgi:D-arginine dehydrogenase